MTVFLTGCRAADVVCLQRNVASTGLANGGFPLAKRVPLPEYADEVCFGTDPESTFVASACECGVAAQGDSFFDRVPLPLIVRFCC